MKVYLDYAATSPVKPEVLEAMMPYLTNEFGNPSSLHSWGQEARSAVDKSRKTIASFLGCDSSEVIFTSGGSESDNLAIKGLFLKLKQPMKYIPHIITTQIEHHAVLNSCSVLEKMYGAEVTYLEPNRQGIVDAEQVKAAIKENTVLVSIMYVNNEIGTVQPIREIGKMIEKQNRDRKDKIYFHTDAVQATEYQNMNVDFLHVDLLTISGHKIGAPKGIGALYKKKGTPIISMVHGGEQEFNLRAGTENVAGIVSLAKATELVARDSNRTLKLRDYFISEIEKQITKADLNGSKENRSPNNINFYFHYIEGESILLNLDLVGIGASSGSACASQSLSPSHVILAVYDNAERAHGSIRFTIGDMTTKEEIDYTVKNLKQIVKKLRDISPLTKE